MADQWRRQNGYAIALTPECLAHFEAEITQAEAAAEDLRRRLGLSDGDDVDLVLAELVELG